MLDTYVAKILMPTTHPGTECPADVNSSAEPSFRKKLQPKATMPMVKARKTMKSIECISSVYIYDA